MSKLNEKEAVIGDEIIEVIPDEKEEGVVKPLTHLFERSARRQRKLYRAPIREHELNDHEVETKTTRGVATNISIHDNTPSYQVGEQYAASTGTSLNIGTTDKRTLHSKVDEFLAGLGSYNGPIDFLLQARPENVLKANPEIAADPVAAGSFLAEGTASLTKNDAQQIGASLRESNQNSRPKRIGPAGDNHDGNASQGRGGYEGQRGSGGRGGFGGRGRHGRGSQRGRGTQRGRGSQRGRGTRGGRGGPQGGRGGAQNNSATAASQPSSGTGFPDKLRGTVRRTEEMLELMRDVQSLTASRYEEPTLDLSAGTEGNDEGYIGMEI